MTKPNAAENTFQMQESCEKSTKLGGFFWKRGKVSSGMERPCSKGEDSTERTETELSSDITTAEKPGDTNSMWLDVQKRLKEKGLTPEELRSCYEKLEGEEGHAVRVGRLFAQARHGKSDKKQQMIDKVAKCLEFVDFVSSMIADNVPGTYGTPAKILSGSISFMIQGARNITDDLDLIEKTFDTIYNALQDIKELQGELKLMADFQERLSAIFIALIDFFALVGKMFTEYKRKYLYVSALLNGRNQKIQAECANIEEKLVQFRTSVPIKIVKHMAEVLQSLKKVDEGVEDMGRRFNEFPQLIRDHVTIEKWEEVYASDTIKMVMKLLLPASKEVDQNIKAQMVKVKESLVRDTFSWTEQDKDYIKWYEGSGPQFLQVLGNSGTGKTCFASHCYNEIFKKRTSSNNTAQEKLQLVAYFQFRGGRQELQTPRHVISSLILQICDMDSKLCNAISKKLNDSKFKDITDEKKKT